MEYNWPEEVDQYLTKKWNHFLKKEYSHTKMKSKINGLSSGLIVDNTNQVIYKPLINTNLHITVTDEDVLFRLAVLPECPQLKWEVVNINWFLRINPEDGTNLHDYLMQFCEREPGILASGKKKNGLD